MAKFLDGTNNGLGYLWNRIKLLIGNKMEKDGSNAHNVVTMPSDKFSVESDEVDESWVDSGIGFRLNELNINYDSGAVINLTKNNDGGTGLSSLSLNPYLLTTNQNTKHFGLRFPLTVGATAWSIYTSYRGKFRIGLLDDIYNLNNLYFINGKTDSDFKVYNTSLYKKDNTYQFKSTHHDEDPEQNRIPIGYYNANTLNSNIYKINGVWYYIDYTMISDSSCNLVISKYDNSQKSWITVINNNIITDIFAGYVPMISSDYINGEIIIVIKYIKSQSGFDLGTSKAICKKFVVATSTLANVTFPITTETIQYNTSIVPFYVPYKKTLYLTFINYESNDWVNKFYKYNGSNAFTIETINYDEVHGGEYYFPGFKDSGYYAGRRILCSKKNNLIYGIHMDSYSSSYQRIRIRINCLNIDTNTFNDLGTVNLYGSYYKTCNDANVAYLLSDDENEILIASNDHTNGLFYLNSININSLSLTNVVNGRTLDFDNYNTGDWSFEACTYPIMVKSFIDDENLLSSINIHNLELSDYISNSSMEYDSSIGEYILKDIKIGNLTSSFFADGDGLPEAKPINNQNYYITHLLTDGHKGLNIRCKRIGINDDTTPWKYYLDFEFDFHSKIAKAANAVIWQANKYLYLSLIGYDPDNDTAEGSQEFKIYIKNKLKSNPDNIIPLLTDARTDKIVMGSPLGSFNGNLIFGSRNIANADGQILLGNDAIPDINDIFALGTNDPQIRDKILSIDKMGNIWSNGYMPWIHGRCNGVLLQDSPYWFPLEDGAVYMINIMGKLNTNNTWRGFHSYAITCPWDSTKNIAQTTAQGVGRWVSITLGANGTVAFNWVCYAIPYVYTDPGTGTTYQKYHTGIGIGSCATNIDMRFSMIKIMGSAEDF